MKINQTTSDTNFSALHFSKGAYTRLRNTLSQMEPTDKIAAEIKIVNLLRNSFPNIKKDIYIHSFETKKNIHFQLSQSKSPIGAIFEHNFVDFKPRMLKVEKSKTSPVQIVDAIVNFVQNVDKKREPFQLAISSKR